MSLVKNTFLTIRNWLVFTLALTRSLTLSFIHSLDSGPSPTTSLGQDPPTPAPARFGTSFSCSTTTVFRACVGLLASLDRGMAPSSPRHAGCGKPWADSPLPRGREAGALCSHKIPGLKPALLFMRRALASLSVPQFYHPENGNKIIAPCWWGVPRSMRQHIESVWPHTFHTSQLLLR